MTPTLAPSPSAILTWEAYMAETEVKSRYDIVGGKRTFMPAPTWRHQRIAKNITTILTGFEQTSGLGMTVAAPFDILVRRTPKLQTRQPDVLFVSHARIKQNGGVPDAGPLPFAPELVVEIVSNSETERILSDKIIDYIAVGVSEVWVVQPDAHTVEVLTLTPGGPQSVGVYAQTNAARSAVFPMLSVPVADIFAA